MRLSFSTRCCLKSERCSCRLGARSSRPLLSASRRRAGSNRLGAPFGQWNLPPHLFGETPNRTTGTVALPFSDCNVPLSSRKQKLNLILPELGDSSPLDDEGRNPSAESSA